LDSSSQSPLHKKRSTYELLLKVQRFQNTKQF
jgi:hypothetical protein